MPARNPTRQESNSERGKVMRSSVLLAETLLALGVLATPYSAAARCRLQVKLVGGSSLTRQARCVDGDPACDSDSKPDTTCDFQASLCFSTDGVTACDQGDLGGMTIASAPGLGGLSNVLEQFKATATPGTLCTAAATVAVPTNGKKKGQVVMKVLAAHGGQRFAFVCQLPKGKKPPKGATVAKEIQKKILDSTCATTFGHGTGAAS